MKKIMEDLKVLWDYLYLNKEPKKSECIIGLGSILTLVPKKCAELYKNNLGDYIIFSGNCGKGTEGVISQTEAERFRDIAINEHVPESKVLIEPNATSTYENFKYIKKVLESNNLNPNSFLITCKPYHERRALAIANIELKDKEFEIASIKMTLEEYLDFVKNDKYMNTEDVINEMIGEISLLIKVPQYGLQSKEIIPAEVMKSYNNLVDLGYKKYYYSDDTIKYFINSMEKKRIIINLII